MSNLLMFGLSAGDARPTLEYYFTRYFIIMIDLFKNSDIQKYIVLYMMILKQIQNYILYAIINIYQITVITDHLK